MDPLMLSKQHVGAWIDQLLTRFRVIAPTTCDDEIQFAEISSGEDAVFAYRNTTSSPKSAFFPQSECTMRFERQLDRFNAVTGVPLDKTPTALIGVRPCDVRSFLMMDGVFLQGRYLDPYYQTRRQNTVIISLACSHPRPTCFCHAFDSGPYDTEGTDVLLSEAGDAYRVQAISARGKELLSTLDLKPADSTLLEAARETQVQAEARLAEIEPVDGIVEMLDDMFDSSVWAEISEKCIACGTCTYVCPTCHCFNIEDRVLAEGGERVRAWDSCMYPTFTVHASGHNPRADQTARWRQRTMHKFNYLPHNVGRYGCVGCGRCILSCPVRLDIRQVVQSVRQAHLQAAQPTTETQES